MQAALDVLAVHQGGTLNIPEGQFIVGVPRSPENAPVNIPSDVRILGAGQGLTQLFLSEQALRAPTRIDFGNPGPNDPKLLACQGHILR
jgi:hypothetical protein